jgi:hypothetical protein
VSASLCAYACVPVVSVAMYDHFASTARAMNVPFELVHRKINVSNPLTGWPHEQFSRKHIVAGTLSSSADPAGTPLWTRSSLLDRRASVSADTLTRNIKLIAEVLARRIYPITGTIPNADAANVIAETHVCRRGVLRSLLDCVCVLACADRCVLGCVVDGLCGGRSGGLTGSERVVCQRVARLPVCSGASAGIPVVAYV